MYQKYLNQFVIFPRILFKFFNKVHKFLINSTVLIFVIFGKISYLKKLDNQMKNKYNFSSNKQIFVTIMNTNFVMI